MILYNPKLFSKYPFFNPYEWRFRLVMSFSVAMESMTLD